MKWNYILKMNINNLKTMYIFLQVMHTPRNARSGFLRNEADSSSAHKIRASSGLIALRVLFSYVHWPSRLLVISEGKNLILAYT